MDRIELINKLWKNTEEKDKLDNKVEDYIRNEIKTNYNLSDIDKKAIMQSYQTNIKLLKEQIGPVEDMKDKRKFMLRKEIEILERICVRLKDMLR